MSAPVPKNSGCRLATWKHADEHSRLLIAYFQGMYVRDRIVFKSLLASMGSTRSNVHLNVELSKHLHAVYNIGLLRTCVVCT